MIFDDILSFSELPKMGCQETSIGLSGDFHDQNASGDGFKRFYMVQWFLPDLRGS